MRLYRGSSASRANLHNLVRLESSRPFLPLSPFIPLPPLRVLSIRITVDPSQLEVEELASLYTAIQVKAPPSYLFLLRAPRTFDSRTIPRSTLASGLRHAARKNLKFRSR